jgi:hypothetical protein
MRFQSQGALFVTAERGLWLIVMRQSEINNTRAREHEKQVRAREAKHNFFFTKLVELEKQPTAEMNFLYLVVSFKSAGFMSSLEHVRHVLLTSYCKVQLRFMYSPEDAEKEFGQKLANCLVDQSLFHLNNQPSLKYPTTMVDSSTAYAGSR